MVAQRTLTPYVEVRILLPLPKRSKCQPVLASFLFQFKRIRASKVSAYRKCAGGTFSAESARAVPHAKRGVSRAYSLQAQRRRRSSLLPLPKRSKCQPVLASFLFPFKRIRLKKQKSEASVLSMVRILKFRAKCVYTIKSAFCYSFKRRPLAFWRSISLMTSAIYAAASTGGMPNRLILDTTV